MKNHKFSATAKNRQQPPTTAETTNFRCTPTSGFERFPRWLGKFFLWGLVCLLGSVGSGSVGSCGLQISFYMASNFHTRMYTDIHAWVEERLRPSPGPSWGDLLASCSAIRACGSDVSTRGDLVNAGLFQKMKISGANKSLNPNRLNPNRLTTDVRGLHLSTLRKQ